MVYDRASAEEIERAKKFVRLVKQLDETKQRAVLQMIRSAAVLADVEREFLL